MIHRTALAVLLSMAPAAAMAESNMPQMDFSNPLTTAQVVWMAVILVALYFTLSRWGLPQIGSVLENRAMTIARDLEAARIAKAEADKAVAELNATMKKARAAAQAEIAKAESDAKAKALADGKALAAKLDAQLAYSEKLIADARAAALAAIKPVAEAASVEMLTRLTAKTPDHTIISPQIEAALAARKAA
jgi:F-type H+-transporting ATPase subunit b